MDCVIEFETQLKKEGKFEDYEKEKLKLNVKTYIAELENKFNEFINEKTTFITEDGDIEKWEGDINKTQLGQELKEYIEKLKKEFDIS